jgi:hypothetical protein
MIIFDLPKCDLKKFKFTSLFEPLIVYLYTIINCELDKNIKLCFVYIFSTLNIFEEIIFLFPVFFFGGSAG